MITRAIARASILSRPPPIPLLRVFTLIYNRACVKKLQNMSGHLISFTLRGLDSDSELDEPCAISSPILNPQASSPARSSDNHEEQWVPFHQLDSMDEDEDDSTYEQPKTPEKRAPPMTNAQKTRQTLDFMQTFSRFSLRIFLETMFTSKDGEITNSSNTFKAGGGFLVLMELWWIESGGLREKEMCNWIINISSNNPICSFHLIISQLLVCLNQPRLQSKCIPTRLIEFFHGFKLWKVCKSKSLVFGAARLVYGVRFE